MCEVEFWEVFRVKSKGFYSGSFSIPLADYRLADLDRKKLPFRGFIRSLLAQANFVRHLREPALLCRNIKPGTEQVSTNRPNC